MKCLAVLGDIDRPEAHLLVGLKQHGIDISVLCAADARYQQMLSGSGIAIEHVKIKSKIDLHALWQVRRTIKKRHPEIVHAFTARALSVVLLATTGLLRKPKIVAYRGAVGNVSRWDPTSWISYFHPRLSAISCVSQAVCRYLAEVGISPSKLHTIYKGHDVSWYRDQTPVESRAQLHIPNDAVVFGCVANMRPSKGVDILFDAIEQLRNDVPWRVVLVGTMKLPETIAKHPNVITLGFRKDASQLMHLFDVLVVPSRREGLPKALIEAMSQGVVPLVTAAGGMPEVVRDGIDGRVVRKEHATELAAAMDQLAHDEPLRNKMKLQAPVRIAESFSLETTVSETAALYRSLVT